MNQMDFGDIKAVVFLDQMSGTLPARSEQREILNSARLYLLGNHDLGQTVESWWGPQGAPLTESPSQAENFVPFLNQRTKDQPTAMHGFPFEYDPTPLAEREGYVVVRTNSVPKVQESVLLIKKAEVVIV